MVNRRRSRCGREPGAGTRRRYATGMCRNIRTLHNFDPPASEEEIRASALQYVRKISGFNKPSRANEQAFERALDAVAAASAQLLAELRTPRRQRTARSKRPRPGLAALSATPPEPGFAG